MGFYNSINTINDFVSQFIDEALALPPEELKERTKHDKDYSFLYAIASYKRNRDVLRDQILSVLIAGRDTTACTLTWIIYHLSMDQAITKRLRQEVLTTIGLERLPTYTDLKI
jgi:cytochrome P450